MSRKQVGKQFSIRGANSGTVYGEAATEQDLEVWFANHPDACEVSRLDFKDAPTIVVIELESLNHDQQKF